MAALAKAAHSLATTVEEIDPRLEELGGRNTERRLGSRAHSQCTTLGQLGYRHTNSLG